jgi:hypothetical protein
MWRPTSAVRDGPAKANAVTEATIAGRSALIRSECRVINAIVDLDDEALLLVLRSRRFMPTGDDELFTELIKTLEIDDSP